jgi:hypothetical protein
MLEGGTSMLTNRTLSADGHPMKFESLASLK